MNNERSNCDKRCPNIDWSRSNTQYSMPLRDLPKTNPASFDKNFLFSRVSHPQRGLKFHHSAGQKNVAKTKTKHFHQTNKNTTPNRLHPTSYGIAPKKHPKSLVENKIDHHKNTSPLHAPGVQTFLAPIPQKLERDFGDGIWLQWVLSMGFSDIRNPYHKPRKNEWSVWLLRVFLVSCPYITIKKLGQKNFILRPCRRYLNQPKRFDAPKLTAKDCLKKPMMNGRTCLIFWSTLSWKSTYPMEKNTHYHNYLWKGYVCSQGVWLWRWETSLHIGWWQWNLITSVDGALGERQGWQWISHCWNYWVCISQNKSQDFWTKINSKARMFLLRGSYLFPLEPIFVGRFWVSFVIGQEIWLPKWNKSTFDQEQPSRYKVSMW